MKMSWLLATVAVLVPVAAMAALAAKPDKPLHVSHGAEIKLADYLVPGKTVVFDFYSDYCPPCMKIAPLVEKVHLTHPEIVVIKVDINRPGVKGIDWKSPVAQEFGLHSIPHFKVFGPDGRLVAEDGPGIDKARQIVTRWFN